MDEIVPINEPPGVPEEGSLLDRARTTKSLVPRIDMPVPVQAADHMVSGYLAEVRPFLGKIETFPEPYRKMGMDGPPRGSVADRAVQYSNARLLLDHAAMTDDTEMLDNRLQATVTLADELAVAVMRNPTSRIRPAFDRREAARPANATIKVEQVGQADFEASMPYQDAADDAAHHSGQLWALQQRIFHAKMDFLKWRVEHDLIAVADIHVDLDIRLQVRTGPIQLTNGRDIKLPDDIEQVHYYVQEEPAWGDWTGHGGRVTED